MAAALLGGPILMADCDSCQDRAQILIEVNQEICFTRVDVTPPAGSTVNAKSHPPVR